MVKVTAERLKRNYLKRRKSYIIGQREATAHLSENHHRIKRCMRRFKGRSQNPN